MVKASLVKELRSITGAGMMDCKKALDETNGSVDLAIDWLRENGIAKAAKKGDRVAAEGLTKIAVNENKAIVIELNSETDFVAKNEQFLDLLNTITNGLLDSDAQTLEEGLKVEVNGQKIKDLITSGTATIGEKINLRRFKAYTKDENQMFAAYSHMGGQISTLLVFDGDNQDVGKQIAMHTAASKPLFLNIDQVDSTTIDKEKEILKNEALNEGKPANIVEKMVEGRIRKYYEEICLVEQLFVIDTDKKIKQVLKENNLNLTNFIRYEVGEGIEKNQISFVDEVAQQVKK